MQKKKSQFSFCLGRVEVWIIKRTPKIARQKNKETKWYELFYVEIWKLPARTMRRKILCVKSDANNKNLINK